MKLLFGIAVWMAAMPPFAKSEPIDQSSALSAFPSCALECMLRLIPQSSCSFTDQGCICTNVDLNLKISECVEVGCTVKESLTTKNASESACGAPVRDRTKAVSVTGIVGGALALLAVSLRLLARRPGAGGGEFGLDDWTIIGTMLLVIPLSGLSLVLANHGLGKDIWTVPFEDIMHVLYIYYFDESLYLASLALTKISILFFYLRIFPERNFRRVVYGVMACCVGYIVAFVLISVFQCRPIPFSWKRWDGEHKGTCNNINAQSWAASAINIFLDLFVIFLPMPQLAKLALSFRRKIQIMLMFGVGFFITIVSILRLKSLIEFGNTQNLTWDYVPLGYWSTVEIHVGIICSCMPALRALVRSWRPTMFTQPGDSKQSTRQSTIGSNSKAINSMSSKPKSDNSDFVPLVDLENQGGKF